MFSDSHLSKVGPSQDNNPNLKKNQQTKQTTTKEKKKTSQGAKKL